jgi:hypothetical protein
MTKLRIQGASANHGDNRGRLHRGTEPKPSPLHGGTNLKKGVTRSPPPAGGTVNSANYSGHKIGRK